VLYIKSDISANVFSLHSMSPISSNAILGAALLLLVSSCAAHAPVVDLGYAQYEGVVDTDLDVTKFLGIRYAAPPTGKPMSVAGALN
jgi:hypothetical protein